MQDAVIFDMDGTLCDVRQIRHLVMGTSRNFEKFHRESVNCPPHSHVVEAAHKVRAGGHAVLIVTARKAKFRNHTAMWLALNGVPSDAMLMRADHDNRKDVEVKRDILRQIRRTWNPIHAWDDNPSIISLWEEEGIPCTIVPGWIEKEGEE